MAIQARTVKNKRDADGVLTGRPGTVYDVNIKYNSPQGKKSYAKRGFATKKEASQHEAEMKMKLTNPIYSPAQSSQGRMSLNDYLEQWLEQYGTVNLRPSTQESYRSAIRNHVTPHIGHVPLREISPAMLDDLFKKMFDKGLAQCSARNVHRILGVALEGARKYRYIEHNPARDVLTKFGQQGKTPDPYTVQQMQQLMAHVSGTEWEMSVMLAGMYGMRMGEILGLRWRNVDMEKGTFSVVEQIPFRLPSTTTIVEQMASVKGKGVDGSGERALPITDATRPYFERHLAMQMRQKELAANGGGTYFDNDIVVAKANGAPYRRDQISSNFGGMLRRSGLQYLRFHDLRHTAATNMHQLTGDFYTVGMILGHSLKGVGIQLGMSTKLDAVTAQYVDVRMERKKEVLDAYHNVLHPKQDKGEKGKAKPPKKKNHDRGL
jgi:integrase